MAVDLQALKDEVARNTSVDQSAVIAINGMLAKIQELIDASGNTIDPAELQAAVDELRGSTDGLAAAIPQNT